MGNPTKTVIEIDHKEGTVHLNQYYGLSVKTKEIHPQSLAELLAKSLAYNKSEGYGSTVPEGVVFCGFAEKITDGEPMRVFVLKRDKCIRNYNHFGDNYRVGYPALLFFYGIHKSRVDKTAVVAVKDNPIKKDTMVYHFPYANVFNNGNVCWGSFQNPIYEDINGLYYAPEAFYTIEHTHNTNGYNQSVSELIDQMGDREFDDDVLVPIKTFGELLKGFLGHENVIY